MKGSMGWRFAYVCCAFAGCLAGFGIVIATEPDEVKPNIVTEDNTLVRELENSVFFDEKEEKADYTEREENAEQPTITEVPEITKIPERMDLPVVTKALEITDMPQKVEQEEPKPGKSQEVIQITPEAMPSLSSQWVNHGPEVLVPEIAFAVPQMPTTEPMQSETEEIFTYPAEIFGQVPVINRTDTYVSYFEFAYDLIEMLEPVVRERGLNLNSLLTKFAIKALFCGVDIEKLDINAPIPRRLAALCLWLAAQVLSEGQSETTAQSAQSYVTDIGGCSPAEKKAVAYLYEQGIVKGYQIPGQKFYPDAGLQTEFGSAWLAGAKQCWGR